MKRIIPIAVLCISCCLAIAACKKRGGKPTAEPIAQVAEDTEKVRKRIKKNVKDKLRREELYLLVDDIELARGKLTMTFLKAQQGMLKRPDITVEEAQAIYKDFQTMRVDALWEMARLRLEMRKVATEKEWNAVFVKKNKGKKVEADETEGTDSMPGEDAAQDPASAESEG